MRRLPMKPGHLLRIGGSGFLSDLLSGCFLGEKQDLSQFLFLDQFDNLEKHTQWGIDVLEKYIKFVKERTEIEINYAKQL
ncbi:hypothetical protein lerEdw1_014655, partial [Lerista edwardsae]